jgi:hypothetical protein
VDESGPTVVGDRVAGLSDDGSPDLALWHVTVTFAGDAVDPVELRTGLERLTHERPFLVSARFACDRVEITYWDEAEDVDDAAALALRLWADHRSSAGLPPWRAVGLEVLDRGTLHERGERRDCLISPRLVLGEVRPL